MSLSQKTIHIYMSMKSDRRNLLVFDEIAAPHFIRLAMTIYARMIFWNKQ